MIKKLSLIILIILLLGSISACSKNNVYEAQSYSMGTVIMQQVYGKNSKKAADEVINMIGDIDLKMTNYGDRGEVNRINSSAGNGQFVKVSPDTYYLLERAKYYYKLSNGAFDLSIGPVSKLWGIGTDKAKVPTNTEINEALKLVGYNSLELNAQESSARLKTSGQSIDLGAIGKGFAGDEAVKIYKNLGIDSAYVNLGGNVVVHGSKPDGEAWKIGIQNPRKPRGNFIGILKLSNKSVVTSGDYERYFESNGKRYHHIFDPKTGSPSDSGLISATIVADSSTEADALSTSTFILGLDKGMKLIESLDNVGAIFITSDYKVYVTDNLADKFTFDDESKEFSYVKKR